MDIDAAVSQFHRHPKSILSKVGKIEELIATIDALAMQTEVSLSILIYLVSVVLIMSILYV